MKPERKFCCRFGSSGSETVYGSGVEKILMAVTGWASGETGRITGRYLRIGEREDSKSIAGYESLGVKGE